MFDEGEYKGQETKVLNTVIEKTGHNGDNRY